MLDSPLLCERNWLLKKDNPLLSDRGFSPVALSEMASSPYALLFASFENAVVCQDTHGSLTVRGFPKDGMGGCQSSCSGSLEGTCFL